MVVDLECNALSLPVCDLESRLKVPPRGFLFCMPPICGIALASLIVVVHLDILCVEDLGTFEAI